MLDIVNDSVKAIVQNQNFVNESNSEAASDMFFCKSTEDSLRGLIPRENKLPTWKSRKCFLK